ncbi:transporter substrate-binding domain-containing protein [Acuticoccus sp. MNP-M23]|uniref:transporter substrate-binding domain-containing protein n=1 Tax=Acuticoccus sp. MNP-M23 TaxID=3072793 RepID=UPI002816109E|nr:transporter substrate-binding domain-containing protein [Acuticoccus sp. MNP-M23]WMS44561.1 transporter substrate-binding domain-containing protein [Acuticoccus sp. MNP-M23]
MEHQVRCSPRHWFAVMLIGLLFFATAMPAALAQDSPPSPGQAAGGGEQAAAPTNSVVAGVYLSPPFVMKSDDGLTGMAIELWNAIAEERDVATEFVEFESIRKLLAAIQSSEIDAAVTGLTITEGRAEFIDFTYPWFDGGLQVMVSDVSPTSFGNILEGLADTGHLQAFAWIGGVILVATLLLTLFDRRFDNGFPQRWRDGIADSFYTVMSVAVSGRPPSRKNLFGWTGRILSAFWLICGLAVIAYVTSSVTSVMTTLTLTNQINGVSDLPGKTVGVLDGGTGEEFVIRSGLGHVTFDNIDNAVTGSLDGEVDAIVADAPVLDYYAHSRPQRDVSVVGEMFEPEKYGFGIAQNSPLRRPLTVALIGAEESGLVEELRTKYFGARQ